MTVTSLKLEEMVLEELKQVARKLSYERRQAVSVGSIIRTLVHDFLARQTAEKAS
jgi:predicted DNA-binding ribbon-helix-helix protein